MNSSAINRKGLLLNAILGRVGTAEFCWLRLECKNQKEHEEEPQKSIQRQKDLLCVLHSASGLGDGSGMTQLTLSTSLAQNMPGLSSSALNVPRTSNLG